MAIDVGIGAAGDKDGKLLRVWWARSNKVAQSRTTDLTDAFALPPSEGQAWIGPPDDPSHPNEIAIWDEEDSVFLYIVPSEGWKVFVIDDEETVRFDGIDWIVDSTGGPGGDTEFRMSIYVGGEPENIDGVIFRMRMPIGVTFPDDMPDCTADSSVGSAGTAVFNVRKNGSTQATVTFTADDVGVYASATTTSWAEGDFFDIEAPSTPDATLSSVIFTFVGTKV